ncbi:hypothetical protein DM01DRAFT_1366717 [Hesseltinella vesiculosa]|uniref:NADH dehydrogenase [ubiquinone] 1 alpha subcomplex subunit 7 n=1 Tax=Hesseltinella vesiculosa TaxID=101127 RepID=A0A1X2GKW3_9FUNG|nr:hypothetical protein DM01DRAFT_1366717 [Hesseltinella vesiculosa]
MSWNSKTWSWVKKLISVNPKSTDGMPVVGKYRTPAPGTRPEKYVYPKSAASNLSNNYYFQRDVRRNYPRLAVTTQEQLSLALEGAAPKAVEAAAGGEAQAVVQQEAKPLTQVLSQKSLYQGEKAVPSPNWGRQLNWKISEDFVLPNDGSYFPMKCYTA